MSQRSHGPAIGGLIVALMVHALAGCRSEARRSSTSTQRDSAGIAIVESSRASWDASDVWTVDTAPALSIGAIEGDSAYLFDRVVGATRLSDGRVVVADGGNSQLRFFDSSGVVHGASRRCRQESLGSEVSGCRRDP